MFKNPDFKNLGPLLYLAMLASYQTLFGFSRVLGIEWVDTAVPGKGLRKSPSISFGVHSGSIALICLAVFLFIAIRRTRKRIQNGEITTKEAIKKYVIFFVQFFLWLLLIAIILPPILHFMYYIF